MRQRVYEEIQNCRAYKARLAKILCWIELLTEDEAYIVKRHIIDGIDWPRISVEYRERWGDENTKSERQMQRIMATALDKIGRFQENGTSA